MKRRKVRHGFLYRLGIRRIRPIGQGHDDAAEENEEHVDAAAEQ